MQKYTLSVEITWLPESLNKTLRRSWQKRHSENKKWDSYIWARTRGSTPPAPLRRAKVRLVRHAPRTLDFDGLVGALKPVVDALVFAGILADDGWKFIGAWEVDQVHRPGKAGALLEIHVTEVNSDS